MTTKAHILHAIREKCIDCCCHQAGEIRRCAITSCALWPYRMGADPDPSTTRGFAGQGGQAMASQPVSPKEKA